MKKVMLRVMTLVLLAALTACAGTEKKSAVPQEPQTGSSQAVSQPLEEAEPQQPTEGLPEEDLLTREENVTLTYYLEGEVTKTQAVLYVGQGYSIYIPAMEWSCMDTQLDGCPAQIWQSDWNEQVMLSVIRLDDMDLTGAQTRVKQQAPGYQLVEDARGGLGGMDAEDQMMDVVFYPAEGCVYALMQQYPLEAAEGFGTRMSVLADTFELF